MATRTEANRDPAKRAANGAMARARWSAMTPAQRHEAGKANCRNRTRGNRPKRPVTMADVRHEERKRVALAGHTFERYGITPEDEARLFEKQRGHCAVSTCRAELKMTGTGKGYKQSYHIDHDHVTQIVRGLLCGICNVRLGAAETLGEAGLVYAAITPVDMFLRDAALSEGVVTT